MANIMKLGGGGSGLNIAYDLTPPQDTTKLWVPLDRAPDFVKITSDSSQSDVDVLIEKKLKLPVPLAHPAILPMSQRAFIIGGYNGTHQDAVYEFDSITDTISQVTTLPVAMSGAAAAEISLLDYQDYRALGSFIFGGYNGKYLDTIYEIAVDAGTEEYYIRNTFATLPVGLAYASAVPYRDKIYIIGGKSASGAQSAVYVYDPVENTCTYYCKLAQATYGAAVAQPYSWSNSNTWHNENVYVFGGYSYKTSIQRIELGLAEPVDGELLPITLPVGLQYASAAAYTTQIYETYNGNIASVPDMGIYVCGGQANSTRSESVILKFWADGYDPNDSTISEMNSALPSMPYGSCAWAYGDTIYIAGGRDGSTYLDTIWRYMPQRALTDNCLRIYTTTFDPEGEYDPAAVHIFNSDFANNKVHVSGVYYGESRYYDRGYGHGLAREQVAYVYNEEIGKWQTLDGSATYEEVAT